MLVGVRVGVLVGVEVGVFVGVWVGVAAQKYVNVLLTAVYPIISSSNVWVVRGNVSFCEQAPQVTSKVNRAMEPFDPAGIDPVEKPAITIVSTGNSLQLKSVHPPEGTRLPSVQLT